MDFQLTDNQLQLQDAARRFARNELQELALELEEKNCAVPLEWRKKYAELGFLGVNMPEEYGGLGLSHLDALIVLEEFAQISSAVAFPVFESSVGPIKTVLEFGSESLKKRIAPAVAKGECVVAISMSEPDAGTALTDLKTKARIEGDEFVISGQKRWCSGGGHSDAYVVYCRLDDRPGAAGIGAVLVEKDRQGIQFGAQESLMGFRGIPSCDIFFDDVRVPLDNQIVPAGGFGKLMGAFCLERCGNATMSLAIAAAALEEALDYTSQRSQFGKPVVDFQAVQLKLADMAMKVEASRLLIWRAAQDLTDQGLPSIANSSIAKCFANEMVREVASMGIQLMGGYGYSKEFKMEQRLRDAYGWGIAGGTIDIQKVNIAAALVGRRFNQRN